MGTAIAGIVIFVARRQRALSSGGAAAALVVGTICAAAGWNWAILLATFFVSSNALSRYRRAAKTELVEAVVEKGGERDMWQVLANGGVFAALAAGSLIHPSATWLPAGVGAIAAVTADTWATEIGTLSATPPKLITTGKLVAPGTSGGVTWLGTLGGLVGACCIAAVTLVGGWGDRAAIAAIAGGVGGTLADSLIGATVQRRRWCEQCDKPTERLVHSCGTTTRPSGGLAWLGNDFVNLISSLTGAVVASIWPW